MKHFFCTIVLVVATFFSVHAQKDIESLAINDSLVEGSTKMDGVDGKQYSILGSMGTKGVVVIFSCNTCPFVVGSESFAGWEKQYNDLYDKASKLGFNVILVNSNEAKRGDDDALDKMKSRAKDQDYKMPYVVDKNSVVANAFGAKTTPHVFVFNTNKVLVYTGAIDNSVDSKRESDVPYLINALTEINNNKPVTESSTPPRGCSIKRVK